MTRTENNKPSQSTPIRKGKMSKEEIEATAKELTKWQLTTTGWAIKTYKDVVDKKSNLLWLNVVEAPKPEPVVHWDYEIIAAYIKAHCATHETFTATSEDLLKMIPQNKRASSIASNFEKIHWLSYRKTEGENNNDTYVFFVEPTREQLYTQYNEMYKKMSDDKKNLIVQLTSAESKVIELDNLLNTWIESHRRLDEENSQLKSDLSNQHIDKIILLWVAILSVISIILK